MERAKTAEGVTWKKSGGRLPGRSTEENGRVREEECVKSRHGQEKNEKIEEGI